MYCTSSYLASLFHSYLHGDYPVGEEHTSEVPVDDQDVDYDVNEVETVAEDQLDCPPVLVVEHVPEEVAHVAVHVLKATLNVMQTIDEMIDFV